MPEDELSKEQPTKAEHPLYELGDVSFPPYFNSFNIEENKKVILLVAGIQPQGLVLQLIPDKFKLRAVPADMLSPTEVAEAKKIGNWIPNGVQDMDEAWEGLTKQYSSDPFKEAQWELVRLWAMMKGQITLALQAIALKKPLGIAVHYIGHGNSLDYPWSEDVPVLTAVPVKGTTKTFTYPYGGIKQGLPIEFPDPGQNAKNAEKTEDVSDVIKAEFSKDIPKTLIVDACNQANALLYAMPPGFRVVVSEDYPRQESTLAAFSKYFYPNVSPDCLDHKANSLEGAVYDTDQDMRKVPIISHYGPSVGTKKGDAYQHPSASQRRSSPDKVNP